MESMSNVLFWQYIVIGGPCAVFGGLIVWAIDSQYIRGLEDIVLNYHDEKPPQLTTEEIAKHLLKNIP